MVDIATVETVESNTNTVELNSSKKLAGDHKFLKLYKLELMTQPASQPARQTDRQTDRLTKNP
jgi:hypothetical protein